MPKRTATSVLALSLLCLMPSSATAKKINVRGPHDAPPILSDFHSMKGANGLRRSDSHQGMDVRGPNGLPILAAADGTVVETDIGKCWVPAIVIDHGIGLDGKPLVAAYGHLGRTTMET